MDLGERRAAASPSGTLTRIALNIDRHKENARQLAI